MLIRNKKKSNSSTKQDNLMWCFNRLKDSDKIGSEEIQWQGPLAWKGFESINKLAPIPDIKGVYLFTFQYKDGFLIYAAGITNSTKRRISAHSREYRKGNYTILNIKSAELGERQEIWHGWQYAKTHRDEFNKNKEFIEVAIENQLKAFRVFVAEVSDDFLTFFDFLYV